MGFFDSFNPFRKKDELGLPPLDGGQNLDMSHPNLDQGHNFDSGNFSAASPNGQVPLDDHRMTMPLGENIRQSRVSAMYGGEGQGQEQSPYHEGRDHNPLQKDLELISSKLDYLKASLDAINQRLVNLEHLAKQELENKRW